MLKCNQHLYILKKWKQDKTLKIQGTGNEYGVSRTRKKNGLYKLYVIKRFAITYIKKKKKSAVVAQFCS